VRVASDAYHRTEYADPHAPIQSPPEPPRGEADDATRLRADVHSRATSLRSLAQAQRQRRRFRETPVRILL